MYAGEDVHDNPCGNMLLSGEAFLLRQSNVVSNVRKLMTVEM